MLSAFQRSWLAVILLVGCAPEIGDKCQLSTDCSSTNERICDPTQPGGYCTLFNCEPGGCPEESVCVAFQRTVSGPEGCSAGDTRLQRTFCMLNCGRNSDCREGYECLDLGQSSNALGATIVERGSFGSKVCAVPASGLATAVSAASAVCTAAAQPFVYPPVAHAGAAGSAGVAGASAGAAGAVRGGAAGL